MKKYLIILLFHFWAGYCFGQESQELIRKIDSLYFEGASKEAFDFALKLVNEGNQDPYILHRLGMIYVDFPINQPKEGLIHLQHARRLTKNDSLWTAIHLDIAQGYLSLRRYEDALKELKIIINHKEYRGAALTISMGIHSETGQFEKAISIARELLILEPDFLPSIANIGFLFLELDQPDSALIYFERANDLKPSDPIILNNIGYTYYLKGDLSRSLNLINQSIEILNTNSYAYRNRAYVLAALNKIKESCSDIERAIELNYVEQYGQDILDLKSSNCE